MYPLTHSHEYPWAAGDDSERARIAQAREVQVFEIVFILVVHQGRLRRGRVSENIFFRSNDKF